MVNDTALASLIQIPTVRLNGCVTLKDDARGQGQIQEDEKPSVSTVNTIAHPMVSNYIENNKWLTH